MSCGNSRSSKCNPCGPSESAVNAIADRAAYYARIAVAAANSACFQFQEDGNRRWAYIGDGIQVIFDIPGAGTIISASYIVGIDGILQDPDNYTVQQIHPSNPYTLTMSVPVPAGSEIVIVSIKGITGATGPVGPSGATAVIPPSNFGNAWSYIGDGSQTVFSIIGGLSTISLGYLVHIDGVYQKSTNYTINTITPRELTISSPVPAASEITIISISTL